MLARVLSHIRQNHALEHATMHLLPPDSVRGRLIGHSDWRGFTLHGDVDTMAVVGAAQAGLRGLQDGHAGLAVHDNCGTNFAAGALLLLGIGQLLSHRLERRLPRILLAALAGAVTVTCAHPVGLVAQKYLTTSAQVAQLHILNVTRYCQGERISHRVETRLDRD